MRNLLAGLLLLLTAGATNAQTLICFKSPTGSGCTPVSAAAPLPVTGGGGGGAVTLASGAVASGAYSSGAYAAGALAAGAFATGAGVDGWDLTQGAKADAAWTTGSGSVISLLKAIAAAEIVANRAVNVAQINGVTPLMGNGATGTGSPRVTIASDNTAFSVNATLSAETTKVIGTVNQGTSPWSVSGNVGGYDVAIPVLPTIQAAAYSSGNAVGALQTVAAFRSTTQPSGILNNLTLAWKGTETTSLTFYLFDTNPAGSTCTDKVAFSLAAADIPKLAMPPFTLTAAAPVVGTTSTFANSAFAPLSVKNQDGSPTVNLYVCAVGGGTFTPAVGDLTYKISVVQD